MGYRNYSVANGLIVDKLGNGDFTTIQAAINAATTGQTIFLRPGTYTENLTLKAGVNLTAFTGDSDWPNFGGSTQRGNVIIIGKMSYSGAGTVSGSNIFLQTNSDYILEVTGSAASVVNLNTCYLNMTNGSGIHYTTSNSIAAINLNTCNGNLGTTGITNFVSTATGYLNFTSCEFTNGGVSTTSSTMSAGSLNIASCNFLCPISLTGTALGTFVASDFDTSAQNVTPYTMNIAGAINCERCSFVSGSASAIVITGGTLSARDIVVNSNNTNAITGAGVFLYGLVTYSGTSSVCNVTTQSAKAIQAASTVAYSPVCGGITANGVLQSVVSAGTAGQVLTSNGNAALPTFQTVGGGVVVQQIRNSSTTEATLTTTIASITTTPTTANGTSIISVSITPTNSSSVLLIEAIVSCTMAAGNTAGIWIIKNGAGNAIASAWTSPTGANYCMSIPIKFYVTAGSTSAITFALYAASLAGNIYVNGNTSATQLGGGTAVTSLIVTEYTA